VALDLLTGDRRHFGEEIFLRFACKIRGYAPGRMNIEEEGAVVNGSICLTEQT
jgi:hypothetical protein